ncbi:MAG: hypothetical protein K5762_01525 [Bacilli bacterium]|nr:hypothetical protein [Bacilli bacterium]
MKYGKIELGIANMKHDPLNHRLLEEFPVLSHSYTEVKEGAFDLDTPAYSFYEEIFVPYILSCLEKNDSQELQHCFDFIEEMMIDEEEMVSRLAMQAILCPLYEKNIDFSLLPLGKESKDYYQTWLKDSK